MNTVSPLVGGAASDQFRKSSQKPPEELDQLLVCAETVPASAKVQRIRTKENPPCKRKDRGISVGIRFTQRTQVINPPTFSVDDKTHRITLSL
jgi:hypothetical protein